MRIYKLRMTLELTMIAKLDFSKSTRLQKLVVIFTSNGPTTLHYSLMLLKLDTDKVCP